MAAKRTPLDRDTIVATAIAMADANGLEQLSMRKLASELGVEAMSLYYHVPNKDELIDGMVDHVIAEMTLPSFDDHWKTAARRRAISAHEILMRHPWAIGIVDSRTNRTLESLRYYDAMVGTLLEAGFSMELTLHALATIDAYVYGFCIQEVNLPMSSPEETAEATENMIAQIPMDELPHLVQTAQYAAETNHTFGAGFTFGLDLILDAFEARLAAS